MAMSKYDPLADHLIASGRTAVPMTFGEIERIIGGKLPPSAFKHRPWWSNNPSNSVITDAWLKAGYKSTKVDVPGCKLVFRKFSQDGITREDGGSGAAVGGSAAEVAPASARAPGAGFFQSIYGALKGTVTVRPGTDLTAPDSTEWDAGR